MSGAAVRSAGDAWRTSVYCALLNQSKVEAAGRFEKCGKDMKLLCMGCGFSRKVAQYCELRVCPECAARQVTKIQRRVWRTLKGLALPPRWRPKVIHLTIKTDGEYEQAVARVVKALPSLWRSYLWRDEAGRRRKDVRKRKAPEECASGAVCGMEFGPKNGNLHVHMIYVGPYLPQAEFSQVWRELVGEGFVWITVAGSLKAAVRETIKYFSDVRKLSGPMLVELYQHLEGRRRIRSYGIFRTTEQGADIGPPVCEHCGGREWMTESGLAWMLARPRRWRRRGPGIGLGRERDGPEA